MFNQTKILFVSDVHLGQKKNPTKRIIANLRKVIFNERLLQDCDMIVIGGDLFDRLLDYPDADIPIIEEWGRDLLTVCAELDIMLRSVEGTPSHDWRQTNFLLRLNETYNIGADVKHYLNLEIEYNARLDMHILYVPDEYRHTCIETQQEVKKLMKIKGLDKVQIGVMHGAFPHQIPEKAKHAFNDTHDPVFYQRIVEHVISIGHVHTSSQYGKIFAQGSFDRNRHNEEEDKGLLMSLIIQEDENTSVVNTFIVNKNAMMFKTLDVDQLSYQEVKESLMDIRDKVTDFGYVRLLCGKEHPAFLNLYKLIELFPELNLTHKPSKAVVVQTETWDIKDVRDTMSKVCLRPDTMFDAIMSEIEPALQQDALVRSILTEVLNECAQ